MSLLPEPLDHGSGPINLLDYPNNAILTAPISNPVPYATGKYSIKIIFIDEYLCFLGNIHLLPNEW